MVGRPEVVEQCFRSRQRLGLGRLDPAKICEVFDPGGFEGEDRLGHVEPLDFRDVAFGAALVVALRPEPDAHARRGSPGPPSALVRRGAADFFNEEGVDPAMGIVAGHAREAGVHDQCHPVDRQRSLRDVCRNNDLARGCPVDRPVLLGGRELAVQWENDATVAEPTADFPDRPVDLVGAGHEDENVPVGPLEIVGHSLRREFPGRIVFGVVREKFHIDRINPPLRLQGRAGSEILREPGAIEGGGHHDDPQVRTRRLLKRERAGQADIAIKMPLVELVEDDRGNALQLRIGQHLAEKDSFRDEKNPRRGRGNIVEPDLVSDLAAEFHPALAGHARGQHPRRQPSRLQDHAAPAARNSPVDQDLRDLRGLSRARRCLQDKTISAPQRGNNLLIQIVNRQGVAHGGRSGGACPISIGRASSGKKELSGSRTRRTGVGLPIEENQLDQGEQRQSGQERDDAGDDDIHHPIGRDTKAQSGIR